DRIEGAGGRRRPPTRCGFGPASWRAPQPVRSAHRERRRPRGRAVRGASRARRQHPRCPRRRGCGLVAVVLLVLPWPATAPPVTHAGALPTELHPPRFTRLLDCPRFPAATGAPAGIRPPDPRLRRPLLYPTELLARASGRCRGEPI